MPHGQEARWEMCGSLGGAGEVKCLSRHAARRVTHGDLDLGGSRAVALVVGAHPARVVEAADAGGPGHGEGVFIRIRRN